MADFLEDGAELFATMCVRDYDPSLRWYEALLGTEPSFLATATEAVWEIAPHRWLVVEERSEHAGHGVQTVFVADVDALVAGAAARGIEPSTQEIYGDGVRKVIFHDPDGNEIGFGGNPVSDAASTSPGRAGR